MNKQLLERIIDSLSEMIDYADDGNLSRYDKEYKDFFEAIDRANNLLEELNKIYKEV